MDCYILIKNKPKYSLLQKIVFKNLCLNLICCISLEQLQTTSIKKMAKKKTIVKITKQAQPLNPNRKQFISRTNSLNL